MPEPARPSNRAARSRPPDPMLRDLRRLPETEADLRVLHRRERLETESVASSDARTFAHCYSFACHSPKQDSIAYSMLTLSRVG